MNTKVQVHVPVPITMPSGEDILSELNRRQVLIKWAKSQYQSLTTGGDHLCRLAA
jgi:hypothetical protein